MIHRLCWLFVLFSPMLCETWTKLWRVPEQDASIKSKFDQESVELEEKWATFKHKFNKIYEPEEEEMRRKIYETNLKKIELHNYLFAKGLKTFTFGENEFTDMEQHEFTSIMNGYKRMNNTVFNDGNTYLSPMVELTIPDSVDWRTKGYVTPVKNQGQCGSCWAFSATGALEGQTFRKTQQLVSLSEQNLVDCSTKLGNEGCNGGNSDVAFQYVMENDGIDTEECYPYTAKDGPCRFKTKCVGASCTSFTRLPSGDEEKLKEAVATTGPISVAIDASHESFRAYSGGVYNEPSCSSTKLNHAVLVVGYGNETGYDYWLVKNSWGTKWGEEGYVKMIRNQNNQCGIATEATFPVV